MILAELSPKTLGWKAPSLAAAISNNVGTFPLGPLMMIASSFINAYLAITLNLDLAAGPGVEEAASLSSLFGDPPFFARRNCLRVGSSEGEGGQVRSRTCINCQPRYVEMADGFSVS